MSAASDPVMEQLQEFENAHSEGPCMDAFRTGEAVVEPDLEQAATRWPGFAPKAVGAGFHAGYAVPLRLRTDAVGALNMYRRTVGALDELELRVARGYADAATIGILHERQSAQLEQRVDQLQHALDSRIVIEQAKGVLVERHGVPPDAAFQAIRTYARSNRRELSDVCSEIVSGAVPDGLGEAASA